MRKGFTLIEGLLVFGTFCILASIVIVAINPTKRLEEYCKAHPTECEKKVDKSLRNSI